MNLTFKTTHLLFVLFIIFINGESFAQKNEKVYVLSKISNQKKTIKIFTKPYFKIKTIDELNEKQNFRQLPKTIL